MNTYTYTEARQKLATLLEQTAKYGEVRIKQRDGQIFVIKPQKRDGSPLAVDGIKTKLSRRESWKVLKRDEDRFREKTSSPSGRDAKSNLSRWTNAASRMGRINSQE